jgi:hypothetical protein
LKKKKILDGKLTDSFKNVNCEFAKNVEIEKKVKFANIVEIEKKAETLHHLL